MGGQVANQVAAPAETRTPNLHGAKIAHLECGWKDGDSGDSAGQKHAQRKTNLLTATGLLMEGDHKLASFVRFFKFGEFNRDFSPTTGVRRLLFVSECS
jgi:hypothetical protein